MNKQRRGELSPAWKGGLSSINSIIRNSEKYKKWMEYIMKRDDYTCQKCGDNKGGNLNIHHIDHLSKIIKQNNITTFEEANNCEELWDTNNGITLCVDCHQLEHPSMNLIHK